MVFDTATHPCSQNPNHCMCDDFCTWSKVGDRHLPRKIEIIYWLTEYFLGELGSLYGFTVRCELFASQKGC